ncbi:MAG: hypothetical protein PHY12_12840, partial [Eubacteriales bacterium]|nr:hypothetical protein [Eubacteriales bacterium]
MTMQQSIKLRRRFTRVTALCFALFLLGEGAFILWYNNYRTQEARLYLDNALQSTKTKLSEMDARLRMIGSYLTVHPVLAQAGKLEASVTIDNETMQSAFDVMRMSVNASSEVEDVVLVNRAGKSRSYVSGLGIALVDLLGEEYDFASQEAENARYFFFPAQHFDHEPLFAFIVPLWKVEYGDKQLEYASIERVGTIVLACRVGAIIEMMDYGLQRPYTCQVLSQQGSLIAENESSLRREDYVQTCEDEDMGVTLRISTEETQYFDSGFFLPVLLFTGAFFLLTQLLFSRPINSHILKPIQALTAEMPHMQTPSTQTRLTPL